MKQQAILLNTLLCCLVLTACDEQQQTTTERTVPVKTMTISTTRGHASQRYSGTLDGQNATPVSFATAGTIDSLFLHDGQRVSKGQLLATIDDTQLRSMHATAQATLDQATDAYQRMKHLHDAGSLTEIKWIEAQTTLSQAQSAEQIARKSLLRSKLTPSLPFPEGEILSVGIGQTARVTIVAVGMTVDARVREKSAVANAASRSYNVRLRIDNVAADNLLPGMVVEVSIDNDTADNTSIVVPAAVVQLGDDNSHFVWTVVVSRARRQAVEIGQYTADGVIVDSGLRDGDIVITAGAQKVCNGTKVEL